MEIIQPKASLINEKNNPSTEPISASGIPGQISMEEAMKGGENAKISTIGMEPLQGGAGNQVKAGSLVEGKLLIEWVDAIMPSVIVVIFAKFKIVIERSSMRLTAKEKETLAPLVQNCMDSLLINFNSPWIALSVTAIVIYGGKALEHGSIAAMDQKTSAKKKQAEKEEAKSQTSEGEPAMRSFVDATDQTLRPWDEDDVLKVLRKRQKGREDAIAWLNKFWVKKKGNI